MAIIGLRYPVFAPITTHADGALPVYEGAVANNRAVSANISWTRNENNFYADDALAESDNGITGGSVTMGLDDLSEEFQTAALGAAKTGTGAASFLEDTDQAGVPGGLGYVRVRKRNGALSYEANWIYKCQLGQNEESTQTRGESIEWQTPELSGSIMGLYVDASGFVKYRRRKSFTTDADARAFIDEISGLKTAGA